MVIGYNSLVFRYLSHASVKGKCNNQIKIFAMLAMSKFRWSFSMAIYCQILLFIIALCPFQVLATNEVSTVLTKTDSGIWRAHFSAKKPVKQIAFHRSPDSSRIKRWKATSAEFEILKINNDFEAVKRMDGKPFTEVEFHFVQFNSPRFQIGLSLFSKHIDITVTFSLLFFDSSGFIFGFFKQIETFLGLFLNSPL